MKLINLIKNNLCMSYCIVRAVPLFIDAAIKTVIKNEDEFKKQYADLKAGEITRVDYDGYRGAPVSDSLFGPRSNWVQNETVGWIVEEFRDGLRPGSMVMYRVLFPQGLFWIAQTWLSRDVRQQK